MIARRPPAEATFLQVLVNYEGPQLVLFQSNQGRKLIAMSISHDDLDYPFFACETTESNFQKYMDRKADLHYLYSSASRGLYYFVNWEGGKSARLYRASLNASENRRYFPEVGFFSRSHTEPLESSSTVATTTHVFSIDGSWDAGEFSRVYNKIEDIYAFFATLLKIQSDPVETSEVRVQRQIESRLWVGGGSYVGFYDDLFEAVRRLYPLRVNKIQYASPGTIEVLGYEAIFGDIDSVIEAFSTRHSYLHEENRKLSGILFKQKLKKSGPTSSFSSEALEKFALRTAMGLAEGMTLSPQRILSLCKGNTLVFCKLVLSFYRRANDLHKFFVEGRMTIGSRSATHETTPSWMAD